MATDEEMICWRMSLEIRKIGINGVADVQTRLFLTASPNWLYWTLNSILLLIIICAELTPKKVQKNHALRFHLADNLFPLLFTLYQLRFSSLFDSNRNYPEKHTS